MTNNARDQYYMTLCLQLASQMIGRTAPNPAVGCIIVKNDQIIAEGVTSQGGRPHAETNALKIAGVQAERACVYVSLEPCAHHGMTGPCANALIDAKIKRVVIACQDPDPRVSGLGIKALQEAGVEVVLGVCQTEAQKLNEGFFKAKIQAMPLVTLKLATSLDGKIALSNKESKWITGPETRKYSHSLRADNDAIMVGIGTVLADDPDLTCRIDGKEHCSPIRIVLDSKLAFPPAAKMLSSITQHPVWIITLTTTMEHEEHKVRMLREQGVNIITIPSENRIKLTPMLHKLAELGITRLLVEGGSKVATSFLKENLFDYLVWIQASKIIGNDGIAAIHNLGITSMDKLQSLPLQEIKRLGNDIAHLYSNVN